MTRRYECINVKVGIAESSVSFNETHPAEKCCNVTDSINTEERAFSNDMSAAEVIQRRMRSFVC
jgi:hypothetical protein